MAHAIITHSVINVKSVAFSGTGAATDVSLVLVISPSRVMLLIYKPDTQGR